MSLSGNVCLQRRDTLTSEMSEVAQRDTFIRGWNYFMSCGGKKLNLQDPDAVDKCFDLGFSSAFVWTQYLSPAGREFVKPPDGCILVYNSADKKDYILLQAAADRSKMEYIKVQGLKTG